MMGNHIIKAARCALLPASQRRKKTQKNNKNSSKSWDPKMKQRKRREGRRRSQNKNPSLRKSSQKTDRKEPSGTGLTSSLTPDCHRKTISPRNKEYLFSPSSAAAAEPASLFFFSTPKLQIWIRLFALMNCVRLRRYLLFVKCA